jgi:transcriptional regulator with XRE-family HTH domain
VVAESTDELRAFGLALRTFRQRAGLSQEALADIAGLHRTYIGSVERGERNVSLLNIHVLAGALKATASELIRTAEQIRQQHPTRGGIQREVVRQDTKGTRKR